MSQNNLTNFYSCIQDLKLVSSIIQPSQQYDETRNKILFERCRYIIKTINFFQDENLQHLASRIQVDRWKQL